MLKPVQDPSLNLPFFTLPDATHRKDRPYVTLTFAQTLDGRIAGPNKEPLRISGNESMVMTHRLRAIHDGILVGIGTVVHDNPQLTVRLLPEPCQNPKPIILDPNFRFPQDAKMLLNEKKPLIVVTNNALLKNPGKKKTLMDLGAEFMPFDLQDSNGQFKLLPMVENLLHHHSISSLMVEGGAKIIRSFLCSKAVDQVIITVAPVWVPGGYSVSEEDLKMPDLIDVEYYQFGKDVVIRGKPSI